VRGVAELILLAGALSAPATAEGDRTSVVVLPPIVEGELPQPRRDDLAAALRDGLARGDFEVVQRPDACKTAACASQVARSAGADYAVTMSVNVERRDYAIALDLVDAETGKTAAHTEERCEVCGIAEAREVVDSHAAALRGRLEVLTLESPTVIVESSPVGAIVRLDGVVVGETPLQRPVDPGTHRARAELPGHVAEERAFEAVAGVRSTIRFDLEPVPRSLRYRRLRTFGWVALGIGAASVISGVTLIGIDGRPNTASCSGANVDPNGNCKFLYATLEPGIAVTAVGVALLATGIGIAIGTRDRKRKHVAVSPLGVTGRF
jgi:TolB-like protein